MTAGQNPSRALRLYRTMQRWADAGWANSLVFGWGVAQAMLVPGLADVVFLPLALAKPQQAYRLALLAATGTILGSIALYWTGALAFAQLSGPMAAWLGVGDAEMSRMHELLDRYGWLAILASTLSPISTKLTSVASGAFGVPFVAFGAALSAGRIARVLVFAYLVQHGGAKFLARWLKVPD
ncbi:MAG: DedA family protein [Phycisphaerae bacterium]|nr:DedA family protein [Gemmatimonadaceae bacterium]